MKHKKVKSSTILHKLAIVLLVFGVIFVFQYQEPYKEVAIEEPVATTDVIEETVADILEDDENQSLEDGESLEENTSSEATQPPEEIEIEEKVPFDPMSLIDITYDIYVPLVDVGVTVVPKDAYVHKYLDKRDTIMYIQDIGNGYHKVQDDEGDVYYITDGDMENKMSFVETREGAITESEKKPDDSTPYVVKYDGDRVLRFTKKLILDDNIADIIQKGTIVYKIRDYEQIFFIVTEDGRYGYMNSQCLEILEPEESVYDIVTADDSTYDFNEMMEDIDLLVSRYSKDLKVVDTGYSTLGHAIPVLLMGNENAENKVLFQASIHAREHASTAVLMKQLEVMLYHIDNPNSSGNTYREMLNEVAYYIIPMSNPDGVMLSQIGIISIEDEEIRQQVNAIRRLNVENANTTEHNYYFEQWKGNINGVDLNRNFDANWDKVRDEFNRPSNNGYKGPSVFSEVETVFLKKYVDMEEVKVTISYHTAGNMIFWWYFQEGDFYNTCYDLVKKVKSASKYVVMSKAQSRYSHGGMKDYALMLGKPSITYEIGTYSSPIPPISVTYAIKRTRVLPIVGEWLQDEIHDN